MFLRVMSTFTPSSYFYTGLKCPTHTMKCKAFEEWSPNQLGEQNLISLLQLLLSSVDLLPLEPSPNPGPLLHTSVSTLTPLPALLTVCSMGTKRTLYRGKRFAVALACVGHYLWSKDKKMPHSALLASSSCFAQDLVHHSNQRVSLLSFASFLLSFSLTLSFFPSIHLPVVRGMLHKEGNLMATY